MSGPFTQGTPSSPGFQPGRAAATSSLLRFLPLLSLFAAGGCGMLYEWRDEPYLRPVYAGGESAARAKMGSSAAKDRDMGCRVLSVIAREARRRGDEARARRLARELMRHYEGEADPQVRSILVAVGLRNAGRGDAEVYRFLKEKLRRGQTPVAAAYTLAALRTPGAFTAIRDAFAGTGKL